MAAFQHPVVAVGASAGGIEALKSLVECLSKDIKATFIILQHLAPDFDSQLVQILARSCKLPCHEADNDVAIEPGTVYVLPPDRYLKIVDHGLFVEETKDPRGKRMPIDYFMRSLAETAGAKAVGVVLSGTGSDGTLGLRAIKGNGGLTFAQSPETALYDGMPRAAIDAKHADQVGTIAEICDGIEQFADNGAQVDGENFRTAALQPVLALIKARRGYDFNAYKPGTIGRRIRRRMNLLRFKSLDEYLEHLRSDANELSRLTDDLLINVTAFFRDGRVWEDVAEKVIAPLIERSGDEPVRVWIPACSSGEEPYTLAILFQEYCETTKSECDWQIFATDLDEDAIDQGRTGLYPHSITGDVSDERLAKHFNREPNGFRVSKSLREKVVFAKQNVLSDPPFSRLDLISCRNLLIYLDNAHQGRLIETFHFALKDDGYLVLGTSDSVPTNSSKFKTMVGKNRIYQRKGGRKNAQFPTSAGGGTSANEISRFLEKHSPRQTDDLGERVRRSLLDRYAPAGVVVDQNGNIEHYTGPVRRFIETPQGKPTNNLYDLLATALRARVRKAIREATQNAPSRDVPAKLQFDDVETKVRVDCSMISGETDDSEPQFLVTFVEIEETPIATGTDSDDKPARPGRVSDQDDVGEYATQLENELEIMREDLQTTVEELETSNEELKASHEEAMASNEELQSANEELETSREELQSLNEELVTVNHQLEDKILEVERTTDDLRNLLTSTRLPVLFLDTKLHISSFTSTMAGLVELRDADIGRPLSDLAMKIDDTHLSEDAAKVVEDLQPIEREVTSEDGKIFLRRLQPYRTNDERIGGVVATFTDVSDQASTTRQLADRERQARIIADLGQKALSARSVPEFLDDVCSSLRQAMDCDFAKVLRIDGESNSLKLVAGAGWKPGLVGTATVPNSAKSQGGYTVSRDEIILVKDTDKERRFDIPELLNDHNTRSGISTRIMLGSDTWGAIGLHDREPNAFEERDCDILRAVANIVSLTLMQLSREEYLARERLSLSLALSIAEMGLWTYNPTTNAITLDAKLRMISGLEKLGPHPKIEEFTNHIHPGDRERIDRELQNTLSGEAIYDTEFRLIRPDGEQIWLEGKGDVMTNSAGETVLLGVNADVTARKKSEDQAEFMMRELDHRVKNLLAVILSICRITSKTANDVESFADAFSARLDAMARTHSLLAQNRWHGTNLRELVNAEVLRQGGEDQVAINGPDVSISPSSAQSLSMLFHELTTNAIKYGALSTPEGSVDVTWRRADEIDERVELQWTEKGGPQTQEPSRTGFGTKVINRLARSQLGSDIETTWHEAGLQINLTLPTSRIDTQRKFGDTSRKLSASISFDILAGKNVLVLDDEWLIAEQHADILSGVGAKIVGPFLSLDDAADVDCTKVDLAILDYALEDHDVIPLASKLHEQGVPIVFVSGYGSNMELPEQFSEELVVAKPAGASAMLESAAWIMKRRSASVR